MRKIFFTLTTAVSFSLCSLALEHQDLMWGLSNNGKQISVDINPLQSYRIQGVVGQDIHLPAARVGAKIKVAILDTGIDFNHPDLKSYIVTNKEKCVAFNKLKQCQATEGDENSSKCRDENLIADANIYPADCHGWSILDQGISNTANNIIGRPDFTDPSGHGTHVAGTILSVTKNIEIIPVQVIGDGPNQPIKPFSIDLSPNEDVRGGYQTGTNLSERIARGIIYAMNSGAQVINLSLGWPEDQNSDVIHDAITEAQNRGIIIVAAAGNDSTNALLRPCQFKGVICVAAHRPDGALASFSNYGFGVDIAAPGVEILSTIPLDKRSIRLPGFSGYDYLSGTSQATPFVTGAVAEMLSRGVPASEVYARLVVGARAIQKELPVIMGPVNSAGVQVNSQSTYPKNILSGLLDLNSALTAAPQSLILPADKEIQVINWDRKSADLTFNFNLKNYWKDLQNKTVSIQLRSTKITDIEPAIISAKFINDKDINNWNSQQEKTVQVKLQIRDQQDPSQSRLPSELSYQVYVMVDGRVHRQFEIKAEVIVKLTKDIVSQDMSNVAIVGSVPQGMSLSLIDEVYDSRQSERDYFLIGKDLNNKKSFNIALMKALSNQNESHYEIGTTQNIIFNGDISLTRPQYKIRMDIDGDGLSEYIYGVIEYLDKDLGINGPYRNHFYIFDQNMNLKQTVLYDDKRAELPFTFYWMKVGQTIRPAWVGKGQEVKSAWDITDLWSQDSDHDIATKSDIHFYYLDSNFKLVQVASDSEAKIVDIIQPTIEQIRTGVLPVLLAQNLGTELKPSYLSDFSVAQMQNAKLSNKIRLANFGSSLSYRNLVDTYADRSYNLKSSASEYVGTIWYGLDAHHKQRVTLIDLEQSKIFDQLISSQRSVFDAALQVRAGFQSKDRRGVFLMTNSEVEYHDLISQKVVSRSLNRYSFFGDTNFVALQFPITVIDRQSPGKKLPALFTTEGSGLSKGVRMILPVYDKNGVLQQMVSPARLRIQTEKGCRSLDAPVFLGQNSGYSMDYYCGDKIIRHLLKY